MVANSVRVISVQRRVQRRNNHVKYLKIAGMGLVLVLVIALASLRVFGFEPSDMRPGLWLTGELVTEPVTDWDFTNQYEEIFIQTNPTSATQHQNSRNLLIFGSRSQKVGTTNASLISVVTPARRFLAAVVSAVDGVV